MLEVVIIICLALALYLLLRHYPDAHGLGYYLNSENFKKSFSKLPLLKMKPRPKAIKAIEEEIQKGNQAVIAPIEIENVLQQYGEDDPELATLLRQANEAYDQGDLRTAEEKSLEVVGKNKRSAEAYTIIGKVSFSRGQFSDAKDSFKTALKCNDEAGEPYFWLGKLALRDDNLSVCIEYYQKAINFEKGYAEWYAELGKAYMEVRQYAKAAKVLKRATILDIDNKEYKDLAAEAEEKQRTHSYYTRYR